MAYKGGLSMGLNDVKIPVEKEKFVKPMLRKKLMPYGTTT
jgi:hypothetical protein